MIPSLVDQVLACRQRGAAATRMLEVRRENTNAVAEWMAALGANVTAKQLAEELGFSYTSARSYLRELENERRVYSWRVGDTKYWSVTSAEYNRIKK